MLGIYVIQRVVLLMIALIIFGNLHHRLHVRVIAALVLLGD
jgi:hypothetical protein